MLHDMYTRVRAQVHRYGTRGGRHIAHERVAVGGSLVGCFLDHVMRVLVRGVEENIG